MAQTGFTPIQLYSSSTPTNTPAAGDLVNNTKGSELAINIADGKLFYKDASNNVQTLADKTWVGTVTNVSALTIGTTGTDLSSTVANSTSTPVITLNVPTASAVNRGALSNTDWSTFNNKQAALVSGTNIKTVNGTTLLGSGDLGTIGVAYGGTGASTASIASFNNITGYTASGATGTTSTNIVFSTSPTFTTPKATTTIGVGNATAAATGAGITFPATASDSSDANTLDDYEEGTWTPADVSGAGLSFTTAEGYYTKIGREVYAHYYVTYPVTANASANAVGGLPFTASNTNAARGGSTLTYNEFNAVTSIFGPKNGTAFQLVNGVGNGLTNATCSSKTIMGCIIYYV